MDAASGHTLAQAVLAALLNRERHGVADIVSVAMYDVACSLQSNNLTLQANTGPARQTGASAEGRARIATSPTGTYQTSDGGYLVLSAYVPKHWTLLTEVIGRPDLAEDPRYTDQAQRSLHNAELTAELSAVFTTRPVDEWVKILQAAGIMACKALTWREVVSSPVFAENRLAVTVTDGKRSETVIRTPARYASFTPAATTPTLRLGEHNEEVLKELS